MCKHSPGIQNILGFVQKAMTQCLLYRDMDEINTEEGEKGTSENNTTDNAY